MAETFGNNFVAVGASNRLSLRQVKLLQQAVDNETRRVHQETIAASEDEHDDTKYTDIRLLDEMGNDLMVIASKMEAGEA